MTTNKFDVYFYEGFEPPRLVASSLSELQDITMFDNYHGDVTNDLHETINSYKSDLDQLKIELQAYGLYLDPTKQNFVDANKAWFSPDNLNTYLENW